MINDQLNPKIGQEKHKGVSRTSHLNILQWLSQADSVKVLETPFNIEVHAAASL